MVYIAHPYRGEKENLNKVEEIIKKLVKSNPEKTYVSPIHTFGFMYDFVETYEQGMGMCLELLSKCQKIILCGDWEHSRGCNMEYDFAIKNNIKIEVMEE